MSAFDEAAGTISDSKLQISKADANPFDEAAGAQPAASPFDAAAGTISDSKSQIEKPEASPFDAAAKEPGVMQHPVDWLVDRVKGVGHAAFSGLKRGAGVMEAGIAGNVIRPLEKIPGVKAVERGLAAVLPYDERLGPKQDRPFSDVLEESGRKTAMANRYEPRNIVEKGAGVLGEAGPLIAATVLTKDPAIALTRGAVSGSLAAMGGADEASDAGGATPGQKMTNKLVAGTVGAAMGLVPGGAAKGLIGPVKSAAAGAAVNLTATAAQNLTAKATYDPNRRMFEGAGDAMFAGALIPTVMHGAIKAGKFAFGDPAPESAGEAMLRLQNALGDSAKVEPDKLGKQFTVAHKDGTKYTVRYVDEVAPKDLDVDQSRQFLASAKAQHPADYAAAEAAHPNDMAAQVEHLMDPEKGNIVPQGVTKPRGSVEITDKHGQTIDADAIIDILNHGAGGAQTRGVFDHEQFHAILKMAGVSDEAVQAAAKTGEQPQMDANGRELSRAEAEERLANAIQQQADHPVRTAMKNLLAKVAPWKFGEDAQLLKNAIALRDAAAPTLGAWEGPAKTGERFVDPNARTGTEPTGGASKGTQQALPDAGWIRTGRMPTEPVAGNVRDVGSKFDKGPKATALTPAESARLTELNQKSAQGLADLETAELERLRTVNLAAEQGRVTSFGKPETGNLKPESGGVPKTGSLEQGDFQSLEDGARQNTGAQSPQLPAGFEPVEKQYIIPGSPGKWKSVTFKNPVDGLAYRVWRLEQNPKQGEQAAFLRGKLEQILGMTGRDMNDHLDIISKAVKAMGKEPPKEQAQQRKLTVPPIDAPTAAERAAVWTAQETERAQKRAAGEAARVADKTARDKAAEETFARLAEERKAKDAAAAAQIKEVQLRQGQAEEAKQKDFDTLIERHGTDHLVAEAERLDRFGADSEKIGFQTRNLTGMTKADAPALRKAAAGKTLTTDQRDAVLEYLRTVDEHLGGRGGHELESLHDEARVADGEKPEDVAATSEAAFEDAQTDLTTENTETRSSDDWQSPFAVGKRQRRLNPEIYPAGPVRERLRDIVNNSPVPTQTTKELLDGVNAERADPAKWAAITERHLSGQINWAEPAENARAFMIADEAGLRAINDPTMVAMTERFTDVLADRRSALSLALQMPRLLSPQQKAIRMLTNSMFRSGEKLRHKLISGRGEEQAQTEVQAVKDIFIREGLLKFEEAKPAGNSPSEIANSQGQISEQGGGAFDAAVAATEGNRPGQVPNVEPSPLTAPVEQPGSTPPATGGPVVIGPEGKAGNWVWNQDALGNRQHVMSAVREAATLRATIGDKLYEWYLNAIHSGPQTWVKKGLGDMVNIGWNFSGKMMTEAIGNEVRQFLGKGYDPNAGTFADMVGAFKDLRPAFAQARANMVAAWRYETSRFAEYEGIQHAIGGWQGRAVRSMGTRMLGAIDEYYMTLAQQMSLRAMANRKATTEGRAARWTAEQVDARRVEHLMNPPEAMLDKAIDNARFLTNKNNPGALAAAISAMRNNTFGGSVGEALAWIAKFEFPVVRTPINLLKKGWNATVWSSVKPMARVLTGAYKANPELSFVKDVARSTVGVALAAAMWDLMQPDEKGRPRITGTNSGTFGDTGWRDFTGGFIPPKSILIGDKYYSYAQIEPVDTALELTVDTLEALAASKNLGVAGTIGRLGKANVDLFRDRTYLKQVDNIFQAMEAPNVAAGIVQGMASQLTSGLVPNLIRQPIRLSQDAVPGGRHRQGGPEGGATFEDEIGSKILPLPSLMPPQALDYNGRPIFRSSIFQNPVADFAARILLPAQVREAPSMGNENRMLWNYFRDRPDQRMPEMPTDTITYGRQEYRMTPGEYRDFAARRADLIPFFVKARGVALNYDEPGKEDIDNYRAAAEQATAHARKELIERWRTEGRDR